MIPFELYPKQGKALLGPIRGSNCRKGYGLKLMKVTGQTSCAYCGISLVELYTNWLQMAVDHVVPQSVCKGFSLSSEWTHDASNCVLSCAACNGFGNRYKPTDALCPTTLDGFWRLRDRIFAERSKIIRAKHIEERSFFDSTPWRVGGVVAQQVAPADVFASAGSAENPQLARALAMKKVESDGELQSLHAQAQGYIYNDYRGATPLGADGNVLHTAKCSYVAKSNTNYGKFFFGDYTEARAWLERNRGRETIAWRRCHCCPEVE